MTRTVQLQRVAGAAAGLVLAGLLACSDSPSPTDPAPGPPPAPAPPTWSGLSLGRAHTCALRNDGAVFCWGDNSAHQVSDAATERFLEPHPVELDFEATAVAAAGDGSCALGSAGQVACWGRNRVGQLGIAGDTLLEEPTSIPGPGFAHLRLGTLHSCGVSMDASVYCWGGTANGEGRDRAVGVPLDEQCPGTATGYLSQHCAPTPRLVAMPEDALDAGPGIFFSCARGASGVAYCWGWDEWGALGDGGQFDPMTSNRYDPRPVLALSRFATLSVGNLYACGVDNVVGWGHCWGAHTGGTLNLGQLGDGSPVGSDGSTSAQPVAGQIRFRMIRTNNENSIWAGNTCGIGIEGRLFCWGSNEFFQLARTTTSAVCQGDRGCERAPVEVDPGPFSDVELGMYHVCALRSGGQLDCWGRNDDGQLGVGDLQSRSMLTEVPVAEG